MNSIVLATMKDTKTIAHKWTYHPFNVRLVFLVKRANHAISGTYSDAQPLEVARFDTVRLSTTGRDDWFGVVTSIGEVHKFMWRTDYNIRVKSFDSVLDAIEYSEKKRAKYVK